MTPKPLPPDQIRPLDLDKVGIYEFEGGARKAPPPPPPAPEGWALNEFGGPRPRPPAHLPATAPVGLSLPETFDHDDPRWRPSALRRFWWAMRRGGRR